MAWEDWAFVIQCSTIYCSGVYILNTTTYSVFTCVLHSIVHTITIKMVHQSPVVFYEVILEYNFFTQLVLR